MANNIKAVFTYRENEDTGEWGWAREGCPWMEPAPGLAVAHDTLEHFPNDNGTPEQEFQALGASIYVRNFEGHLNRRGRGHQTLGENFASDFIYQVNYLSVDDQVFDDPGRVVVPSEIDYILQDFRRHARREREYADVTEHPRWFRNANIDTACKWIAKGYRRACRRYKHWRRDDLLEVFCKIEDQANRYGQMAECYNELIVTVHTRTHDVKVRLCENGEDY